MLEPSDAWTDHLRAVLAELPPEWACSLRAFDPIMSRAPAVLAGCAVLVLLTANCHPPSPRPAQGPVPEVLARPTEVAPHPAAPSPAMEVATSLPRAEPPEVAPPPAASPCDPLAVDSHGVLQSSQRIYVAAREYFLAHTTPGSPHALGPELAKERPSLRFSNASRRETGDVLQATIDELVTKYPDSVVVPATQPLRTEACYDEVYLDLTEDGRYLVLLETDTARPVFMYRTAYRP